MASVGWVEQEDNVNTQTLVRGVWFFVKVAKPGQSGLNTVQRQRCLIVVSSTTPHANTFKHDQMLAIVLWNLMLSAGRGHWSCFQQRSGADPGGIEGVRPRQITFFRFSRNCVCVCVCVRACARACVRLYAL